MSRRRGSGITATDQFCGAGGSTTGAKRAGVEVKVAMNHWSRAVETYNTNHPDTDVHCADVSAQDPRRFPSTDILITSPECTTHSPAGGNRRSKPDVFTMPEPDDPAFIRSRATMRDVPRFAEYHEYKLILVENVVEVTRWGPNNDGSLFRHWLQEMELLGYRWKLVSLNSMFCWPTPQSRDRLYIVFWRKGNRAPDMSFTPAAPCYRCEKVVHAVQTWKVGALDRSIAGQPFGKYRTQYVYTCPACRSIVTPFYYAALNAIDFSLPAERIGDRDRPLKERTLERIKYGLEKYGNRHLVIRTNMTSGVGTRVRGLDEPHMAQTASWLDGLFQPVIVTAGSNESMKGSAEAMPTQTATERFGLLSSFLVGCANTDGVGRRVRGLDEALNTVHAGGNNHALMSPFFVECAYAQDVPNRVRGAFEALFPQTTQQSVALVSPAFITMLRTNSRPAPLDSALHTVCAGTVHHVLIQGAAQLSMRDANGMRVAGLDRELMTQGGAPQQGVIQDAPFLTSYYGNHQAAGVEEPVDCVNTHDRHALVTPKLAVEDCYFRMLQPHEIGRAMAFPDEYVVTGNKRDQVKQYGNAVTPPAMDELVRRAVASLAPEAA